MSVEKHPDILDQAQALTEHATEQAIAAIRGATQPEWHPDFDGKHCVEEECGEEIPQARLDDGRVRCVACQSLRERAQSLFRR